MAKQELTLSKVLAKAIGSNVYIQIVQTAAQFLVVPLMGTHWGLKSYGVWVMLSTIPSYLIMADIGLSAAAANDMTASFARGDRNSTLSTYQALRAFGIGLAATMLVVAAMVLWVIAPRALDGVQVLAGGHARAVVLMLVAYGALGLLNGINSGGFRALGLYSLSSVVYASLLAIETALVIAVVASGGGIFAAALTYLAVRSLGSIVVGVALFRAAPWLTTWRWRSSFSELRRLARPAVAVMALPAAQAISIQGTVLVIGFVLGSAAVPAFTAVRTVSRVAIQATLIVNHGLLPSFTAADAVGDKRVLDKLTLMSVAASLGFGLPAFLLLPAFGGWFVSFWTRGVVHADFWLLVVMAGTLLLGSFWTPLSNLVLAINKHEQFTWYYLAMSLAALGLSVPLLRYAGVPGAGFSLVLLDLVMTRRVLRVGRKLNLFHLHKLYATALAEWRIRRPSRWDPPLA